jgi:methylphosphotriester-DNA--protein-cysteine methyltransferase
MEQHSKRIALGLLAYAAQRDLSPESICQSAGIDWKEVNDETKPISPELIVRTLQRRLKEDGVTFEMLVDEVRKTMAISYLRSGDYPVKEISWMLGYNDLGNFTRTFKRWTGMTPSSYQNSLSLR